MKFTKTIVFIFFITFSQYTFSQQTNILTNNLKEYDKALELYHNKSYVASQQLFKNIQPQFDDLSEYKANCEYYAANCAIRLGQQNADELMQNFVKNYPTSTKRNDAFLEVADYYFKHENMRML